MKFMQNAGASAKPEAKPNRLRRKWNLLENMGAAPKSESEAAGAGAPPADTNNILIEEDEESDSQDVNTDKKNPVSEGFDKSEERKRPGVNASAPEGNALNPLLSSAELSEGNESTYRSAASEFGAHDKANDPARNLTFSKEKTEAKAKDVEEVKDRFASPQVNSRIVQTKLDTKPYRNLAYPATRTKERRLEPPTTADTRPPTDPSTNLLAKHTDMIAKIDESPSVVANKPLAPEELLHGPPSSTEESKKASTDKTGISMSTTLRPVSSMSSHPSLGQSTNQPGDSRKLLANLREKYRLGERKDPNASSSYMSAESPQFKASEMIKEGNVPSSSSEKPQMSGSLKVQQLSVGQRATGEESGNKAVPSVGSDLSAYTSGGDYKESLKDFLRLYIDNRMPEHLRSYKSPARMFKTRFYQRFYDKYSSFMDQDVQVASYYESLEHAKPVLSESRAQLYQSQLADTMKKSDLYLSKFNV
ncbi:MAG: hypothetical protein P4L10_16460 [Acidobacteriaceae bacterium]|nr:hypothetical protein [Acidobacteriaceae bacterium]